MKDRALGLPSSSAGDRGDQGEGALWLIVLCWFPGAEGCGCNVPRLCGFQPGAGCDGGL